VLTSTDNQSRNRRFGLALAAGKKRRRGAAGRLARVVEGYSAARAVHSVALRASRVDMPIVHGIYRVLYEHEPAEGRGEGRS
jgi:glycerol-3-phosphate dehydrogenase (NAD(P)+)